MNFYPFYQWVLFFLSYCMVGWVWETSYDSVLAKRFVNRGFLFGPWIPIYGFGAIIMLFSTLPVRDNWILTYIVGMCAATVLELCTGLLMEKIFKIKYWDYSDQKLQYKGYICLTSSLFWGLLSVVLVKWVHPFFEKILFSIPEDIQIPLLIVLCFLFATDLGFSIKNALDIRELIVKMEKIKKELDERIDATKEEITERIDATKEEITERIDATKEELSERIDATKEGIAERIDATKSAIDERTKTIKDSVEISQEAMKELAARIANRHPTAKLPTLPRTTELIKNFKRKKNNK